MIPGTDFQEILEALLDAFDSNELAQLLRFNLDVRLDAIAGQGPDGSRFFQVMEWCEKRDLLLDLVQAAYRARPKNERLRKIYEKIGLAVEVAVQKAGAPMGAASTPSTSSALEALVNKQLPLVDLGVWREKLAGIENQVCRVDFDGRASGTGFLVGADLVLTNYHVVEAVLDGRIDISKVACRFDYKVLVDGSRQEGVPVNVQGVLDFSKYTQGEGVGDPDRELPAPDQLDHALLRLSRAVGNEPVGAKATRGAPQRGWVSLPAAQPPLKGGMPVLIAQYPDGNPIKLALDTNGILSVNKNATRVRYATNTEPGSSGSPCFDMDWKLVALHHMGDPTWGKSKYNEGIPIGLIAARLRDMKFIAAAG